MGFDNPTLRLEWKAVRRNRNQSGLPSFQCRECSRSLKSLHSLIQHLCSCHWDDLEDVFELEDCGLGLNAWGQPCYGCPCGGCDRGFSTPQGLALHLLASFEHRDDATGYTEGVLFSCSHCDHDEDNDFDCWGHLEEHTENSYDHAANVADELGSGSHTYTITAWLQEASVYSSQEESESESDSNSVRDRQAVGQEWHCHPCRRTYRSAAALADHRRQSPAHNASGMAPLSVRQQEELLASLQRKRHALATLQRHRYRVKQAPADDYDDLVICDDCGEVSTRRNPCQTTPCLFHQGNPTPNTRNHHPEWTVIYTCCMEGGKGCLLADGHDYKVPVVAKEKRAYYLPTPPSNPSQPKRRAVVLDCEMVGYVQQHDPEVPVKIQNPKEKSEVIRVSAVDMLTGEVLINSFVAPPDKHQGNIHWRTSFTGVTAAVMEEKQAAGELIASWKDVRAQLWKYIDSSTILVGHALHHDLEALRMVHTQVVDTQILADEMMQANDGVIRQWSLKRMCESLLRETIQKDGAPHSPLEDAYATRKLAIKLLSGGDVVADWMQRQRLAIDARRAAAAKAKQARKDEPRVLYSGYMSVGRPN